MDALWLLPVVILLAFAVMLLAPLAESAASTLRLARVRCPVTGKRPVVVFVERSIFGVVAPTDVESCAAVTAPGELTCGKACLGAAPRAQKYAPVAGLRRRAGRSGGAERRQP